MRQSWFQFAMSLVAAGILAATISPTPASAQNGRMRAAVQQRRAAAKAQRQAEKPVLKPNPNGPAKAQPNLRAMDGLPPKWVENMRDMPPDQQQHFMENDARFKNLPPARQEQIRNNLQKWNSLTPQQQEALRQRETALEQMSPEQRQYFTNVVGPRYQALPPDRKQVINRHLAMLGQMSAETQQAALNDPRFTQGMSPDEQQTLRDMNSLRNPPPTQ